jgi:protein-L-isoaspartate O-methyltransferase
MPMKTEDHWSSEVGNITEIAWLESDMRCSPTRQAYQNVASFVPKLATKVVEWLDVQPEDVILDIGCGGEKLIST